MVQLLVGLGLLPLRQGLGGVPRHPDGLHRVLRREARPRRVARPPDRGDRDRARPDRRGVLRADRRRREPRDVRGQARPGPPGLPVRREPQLLRRALGHVPGLGQDAPARPAAHRRRASSAKADDIFLLRRNEVPDAIFDYFHGWAVGVPARGPQYWGREIPRRQGIMQRAAHVVGAAGARRTAGGDHRAVQRDALGRHVRLGQGVARRLGQPRRHAHGLRRLPGRRRGPGPGDPRAPTASASSRRARSSWRR